MTMRAPGTNDTAPEMGSMTIAGVWRPLVGPDAGATDATEGGAYV